MNEEEIFQLAADMPAAERAAYLRTACEGQPALRERLERLLYSHDDGGFMQRPVDRADSVELQAELARLNPEVGEDRIGNYKLLQKIGEGGFGTVWMAEQLEPVRRGVALKIIKPGMDTKEVIVRFEQERQALALMDHPNIAKVLDAGVTPLGRPFFVMELVRGIRITDFCDQNNLPTRERLDLFIVVCNAIQHAHQKGVIHRDIKPSNILVTLHDGVPVPKVIDFGVAKAIQSQRLTDLTFFTRFDQMIGTPLYMSPEQAEMSGLDIDTRSDIYSLGVLLYELLTGQTPFDAEELMASGIEAMRKMIREKEPLRPSTRLRQSMLAAPGFKHATADSSVATDLDWVVMKCLEKDRGRRYATANGLAADLQRHLSNEPVVARPPTTLYRFQKMVRRNKFSFVAASIIALVLVLGVFVSTYLRIRAINAERVVRRNAYSAEINVAFHALTDNNLGKARELLNDQRPKPGEDDLRGFDWRYLWQLCQGDEFATFRDEGAQAATFSPNGKIFVYSDRKIIVRELASPQKILTTLPSPALTLSFAPHTNLLASGHESGVKLWNTDTWQMERSLPDTVEPSLFSPDGRWLLTGVAGALRVWNTQTWQPMGDCPGAPQYAWHARNSVAFSPDSQFLVTVAGEKQMGDVLRVWRLPGPERLLPDLRFESEGDCRPGSVAFSADGKHVVMGVKDGRVVVWDFATRTRVLTTKEHTAWVSIVAVAPDCKAIATASSDRTINLWDASSFKHLVRLRGHVGKVLTMATSPNGRILASGSQDGTTKLWDTDTRHSEPVLEGFGILAGFTGGSRQIVTVASNTWCIWTPSSGERVYLPIPVSPAILTDGTPYAVTPDQPLGLLGRIDGTVELWHLTTGAKVNAWSAHDEAIGAIACSPDGKLLATGSIKGDVKIWSLATQRVVARFGPVDCALGCLAFSPDGRTLAGSGTCSSVWLWDVSTSGRELQKFSGHEALVASVAFSPDGRLLATPSLGDEVRLWDLPSGKRRALLNGHVDGATAVAFSPDGKTLVTGGLDKKTKLWSVATKQELATFPTTAEFPMLKFSPDGRMLAIGDMVGDNQRIHVLCAPSFEEIAAVEAKRDPTESPTQ